MKAAVFIVFLLVCPLILTGPASAHYGMVIPSDSMVMQGENKTLSLKLSFSHPFEEIGMELEKPEAFGLIAVDKKEDLLGSLKQIQVMGKTAWETGYTIKRPGIYIFYMEPKPYWEPAEDCFIVHHTKTVVAAFGDDEGWDKEAGLKSEIVPLSKPFGLYAGNVFQGIVKVNGQPVPYAEVEIEYYNEDKKSVAPTEYMITQTVKADSNGVFTYAVPRAGWWGFAALSTADYKLKHEGQDKDVEIGAVIWVQFHNWKSK